MNSSHDEPLELGCVVALDCLVYDHVGVVTGLDRSGQPLVSSNSARRGGVYEESIDEFRQGGPLRVSSRPVGREVVAIVRRARSMIGRQWDLLTFNCDHFVELALGREPRSRQLQGWLVLGAVVGAIWILSRGKLARP